MGAACMCPAGSDPQPRIPGPAAAGVTAVAVDGTGRPAKVPFGGEGEGKGGQWWGGVSWTRRELS